MIESIEFKNIKALRDAKLPLGKFTLIVGPNGSGKTTALRAVDMARSPGDYKFADIATADGPAIVQDASILIRWAQSTEHQGFITKVFWQPSTAGSVLMDRNGAGVPNMNTRSHFAHLLAKPRTFTLEARSIGAAVNLKPTMELLPDGANLAGVLDRLRDEAPERFEALTHELRRWLPEFDRILFETPRDGARSFSLRTSRGQRSIRATELSQGTLIALAILTLAYLPDPPNLIGLEEPDRGIHPRLLRQVQEALYRLSHPEAHGESRPPVQVIATTHSPYMLELYRDHPDEIVIAHKTGLTATFERLSDRADLAEILDGAHLGEVWYSGVLGGVPGEP